MGTHRIRAGLVAGARGAALLLLSLGGSLPLFVFATLTVAFLPLGLGLLTTPLVVRLVRAHVGLRRRLARDWCGLDIPAAYRPPPRDPRPGLTGQVERTVHLLREPVTWRDHGWLLVDATAGTVLALLPAALLLEGAFGTVLAAGLWEPIVGAMGTYWYAFVPVSSQATANLAALLGLVALTLGLLYNPVLLRLHFRLARALLGATKHALAERVARLHQTRHDAVDASAAELRRIERDLHDGAQARLVAMGMSLGTAEALLEKDPEQARRLLAEARETSAEALTELRDLVRGIHPPVLAERGLGDAVRALALRSPLPTDVTVDLPRRLPEPVESAAYFAVSEALTNAAKHARAHRVWVDLGQHPDEGVLRVSVTDDGRGGARLDGDGTGLRGVERRLGPFDGVLAVSSPPGGPTVLSIEIPCPQPDATR